MDGASHDCVEADLRSDMYEREVPCLMSGDLKTIEVAICTKRPFMTPYSTYAERDHVNRIGKVLAK